VRRIHPREAVGVRSDKDRRFATGSDPGNAFAGVRRDSKEFGDPLPVGRMLVFSKQIGYGDLCAAGILLLALKIDGTDDLDSLGRHRAQAERVQGLKNLPGQPDFGPVDSGGVG